ncbi:hypothetical protein EDM00_03105 [Ornithobacterium rhinotracheale]|uniref:hypothetical protein n=1 Tax=Ornithobacterium rhinotracheale TaxID=28251 RepID=UPI00129D060A|nr:hypothetical protein [Ornithobacterium rhinotracheale]MRI62981.1 hypothetical protein [Ornithobacterium rhinotracheale]
MKKIKKAFWVVFSVGIVGIVLNSCLNSYFGWYGYGYWKTRTGSSNITDSKKRDVFEKVYNFSLHLKPGYDFQLPDTMFYMEKGFKYGKHGYKYTNHLKNPKYPYQIRFRTRDVDDMKISFAYAKEDNKNIEDSISEIYGLPVCLKHKNDTIILRVVSWDKKFQYSTTQDTIGYVKLY